MICLKKKKRKERKEMQNRSFRKTIQVMERTNVLCLPPEKKETEEIKMMCRLKIMENLFGKKSP